MNGKIVIEIDGKTRSFELSAFDEAKCYAISEVFILATKTCGGKYFKAEEEAAELFDISHRSVRRAVQKHRQHKAAG